MAPKKGKKGKKGKKKGKGKKTKGKDENSELVLKRLLKSYESHCKAAETPLIPFVKQILKDCIETNQLWVKIIVEPLPQLTKDDPQVQIEPLIDTIRTERYVYIKDIYIWDLWLKHENVAALALLIEKGFYTVQLLEIQDCLLEPSSVRRLSMSFNFCKTLTSICLDYNEFGDEGCQGLCTGLNNNKSILSLSLCYCELGVKSGTMLGEIVATTAIMELLLDGNNLGAEGVIELVKQCAEFAELETFQKLEEEKRKLEEEQKAAEQASQGTKFDMNRIESASSPNSNIEKSDSEKPGSAGSKKGKKKGKKGKKKGKKKEPPGPPPCGPWIQKLHLADNGVDITGPEIFAPIVCMRVLNKLIVHSSCLEELDLDKNLIGDLGARCIMEGLNERSEASLPSMGVRVTHRISEDVFSTIAKLGSGVKKKKGRKGKKGKKKK